MSKSPNRQREELIRKIEEAFSDSQYPGDDRLVYDNSGRHFECAEIAKDFRGKDWREIPLETLRYHSDSLFFFTPKAYHFYLPAYLMASILSYREADIISSNVVYSLTYHEEKGTKMDRFIERTNCFSSTQQLAIRSFLEFLFAQHSSDFPLGELNIALDKFWRK